MNAHNENIKLKLAWQTAFELRTCPDSDTLYVTTPPDENLKRHLAICHVCRENSEMQQDERNAWKTLRGKFATIVMTPGIGTDKHSGQVWTIKRDFGGWREDGRYIRPPSVLLLEKIDGTSGWRVAQLYGDTQMMGNGDVVLDERYGFAEAYNCYTLKNDRFDKCLGVVKPEELEKVLEASVSSFEPAPVGSILSYFRRMEAEVGAFVAVPAVVELVEEWDVAQQHSTINGWLEQLLGNLSQVKERIAEGISGWSIPEAASSIFDFLAGSELEHASGYAADSGVIKDINLVSAEVKGLLVGTLTVIITADDQLDDGTYFISGRLKEAAPETLYLLARLVSGDSIWETERITIKAGKKAFSIKFKDVPNKECIIDNVRMLLVNP